MTSTPHLPMPIGMRAEMLQQLAALSKAGIAPAQAMPMIRLPGRYQARMDGTRRAMQNGQNIAQAGLRHGLWTPLEAGLLGAALAAGDPTPMYRRMADYYTEKARQLSGIRSRLMMPAFTFVMFLFVTPLPQLVAGTLTMGAYLWQALRALGLVAAVVMAGQYGLRRFQMRSVDASASWADHFMLRLPVFGAMHRRRNLGDFWQSMALLLEAGLPMFDALPLAMQAADNVLIRQELARILPLMQQGMTLSDALRGLPSIANPTLLGMVHTGEASGSLPEMLTRYAKTESIQLEQQQRLVAEWIPRVIYSMIAAMIAYSIFKSGAFMPHAPLNP